MSKKILIVEDERIIAEDIKNSLLVYHYEVINIVSRGAEAIEQAKLLKPEMILMDIKIEGAMDGIETAAIITKEMNIPIVYLTANADESTLQRAKDTKPYGYIVKPFEEVDLNATLEIAFAKYESDQVLLKSQKRFEKLIEENTDGIAVINKANIIIFVNAAYENLFGKTKNELIGKEFELPLNDSNSFDFDFTNQLGQRTAEVRKTEIEWEDETAFLVTLRDVTERKKALWELEKSSRKMQKLMENIVNGLVSAIEMRDPYTAGHQRKVAELACAIGRKMELSEHRIQGLRIASLVHDIGKIQIPAGILSKPGKLDDIEFEIIKSHPQAGYEILKSIDFPWPIAKTVLQHHVRKQGKSYPVNQNYNDIILEARILSVADVVEAMSSHRPYRPALGMGKALEEIRNNSGTIYDKDVVDACLSVIVEDKFEFQIT